MGLVVVAINSGSTVVNERSDTAGDIPVTISGALVCVVEETVVGVFFVRRRLWDWVERVIYGALEGGHLGSVARLICLRWWVAVMYCREAQDVAVAAREYGRRSVRVCDFDRQLWEWC